MDDATDFAVLPYSGMRQARVNEVFAALWAQRKSLPWPELRERIKDRDELPILMDAAAELAAVNAHLLFRKRDDASEALISIWLGSVLRQARAITLPYFGRPYHGIPLDALRQVAQMSADPSNVARVQEFLLSSFGIAVVFERAYSAMKLDGATTRLPNGIPVIGLSLRYSRYDHFWFTLLHELSHVALHYSTLDEPICDDFDTTGDVSEVEAEANRMAADSLIPRRIWNKAEVHRSLAEADLMRLASDAEIHPAVAAGMLRRKNADYRIFSRIVNELDTRQLLGIDNV